jgi:hypothetical protein
MDQDQTLHKKTFILVFLYFVFHDDNNNKLCDETINLKIFHQQHAVGS